MNGSIPREYHILHPAARERPKLSKNHVAPIPLRIQISPEIDSPPPMSEIPRENADWSFPWTTRCKLLAFSSGSIFLFMRSSAVVNVRRPKNRIFFGLISERRPALLGRHCAGKEIALLTVPGLVLIGRGAVTIVVNAITKPPQVVPFPVSCSVNTADAAPS